MMNYEAMMELLYTLEACGDCYLSTYHGELHVDLNDFEGFNEDYEEIMWDYEQPELVEQFEEFVEEVGEGDFYVRFELEGHPVVVGYTSYDI